MSTRTREQILRHVELLNRLSAISGERDAADAAAREANQLWNLARLRYAHVYTQIVEEFGREAAPRWIEAIHGPRITEAQVQAVDSTMDGLA